MVDATWTTSNEQVPISSLRVDDFTRGALKVQSLAQEKLGLVSWGGYVFHVYREIMEKHSVDMSEYAVPGDSSLGYRVQNKINNPSEIILDTLMVSSGLLSVKTGASASFLRTDMGLTSFFDALPWVTYPLAVGGIMDKLKQAMYKGWALPYNGKYGRIQNMVLTSIESLDNEETVYGCPLKLHLKQVLGINHRTVGVKLSAVTCPVQSLITR